MTRSDEDDPLGLETGRPVKPPRTAGSRLTSWLDKAQVVVLFAALIAHPTAFAFDLGGGSESSPRRVIASFGLMGHPAGGKAPHMYVTIADILIGIGFGLYVLRWLLRWKWRAMPRAPLPVVLIMVWFALSAISSLKPGRGREVEFSAKSFVKEFLQAFEYLVAAYLVFEEGFRSERIRRAAAVILLALATVVVAWAWVHYADVSGTASALKVSGPLATRNSLGSTLALMLPFAFGVGLFSGCAGLLAWSIVVVAAGLLVILSGGALLATALALMGVAFLKHRWWFVGTGAIVVAGFALLSFFPALPRDNIRILEDSLLLYRGQAPRGRTEFKKSPDPYGVLEWMSRVDEVKGQAGVAAQESWAWRQKYKEWQIALRMIVDSPLFGMGGGAFAVNTGRYYNKMLYDGRSIPKLDVDLMEPEGQNYYLLLGATLGIPAVFFLVWLLLDHARYAMAGLSTHGLDRGVAAGALGALAAFAVVCVFTEPLVRGTGVTFIVMLALARSLSPYGKAAPAPNAAKEPVMESEEPDAPAEEDKRVS